MNILMVTERYIPIWGGAENQLQQLAPHLIKRGVNVTVLTRKWNREWSRFECHDEVKIVRVGLAGSGLLSTLSFIGCLMWYCLVNMHSIDILHSHGAAKMGALCTVMAKLTGQRSVCKIATAGHINSLGHTFLGRIILKMFKYSDAIIAMTDEINAELLSAGFRREAIINITNGVDCKRFRPVSDGEKNLLRERLNIPLSAIIILFSGRLVRRKGLDVVLKVWPELIEKVPDCRLFVLGSGKTQSDSVENELKKEVAEGRVDKVVFLGETTRPELYLQAANIFVFPSRIEGFPNALMEAMATGLGVVASDIGGVKELVEHGKTGFKFESDNSADLLYKCVCLARSNENLKMVGVQARNLMLKQYSFEKISSEYMVLYKNILK